MKWNSPNSFSVGPRYQFSRKSVDQFRWRIMESDWPVSLHAEHAHNDRCGSDARCKCSALDAIMALIEVAVPSVGQARYVTSPISHDGRPVVHLMIMVIRPAGGGSWRHHSHCVQQNRDVINTVLNWNTPWPFFFISTKRPPLVGEVSANFYR
jgi:hypothetical protein